MRKATKKILSFAVVLIAGLNFIIPAFAQDPFTAVAIGGLSGLSGAGLFSSMSMATGVSYSWNNSSDPLDAMYNVTNPDYVLFHGEKHEATNIDEDIYDYIQVDIGDWLSAQSDFIVENITRNNIQNNSSGNLTDNTLFYNGVPNQATATLTVGEGVSGTLPGGITYTCQKYPSWYNVGLTTSSGRTGGFSVNGTGSFTLQVLYVLSSNNPGLTLRISKDGVQVASPQFYETITNGYSVGYTSGNINSHVFDGWESAKVKIPSSVSQLNPGWTVPDFLEELNRLWENNQQSNIVVEDGSDVPPVPPVPVPTTPLGEVPFDDWVDLWGQGIYEQLENQSDALDFIGSNGEDAIEELESIDSNLGDIKEDTGSIDTNIGIGTGLLGGIKSAAESAVEYLEGIAEHVEELVEEIVEGTETLIAGILNQIPTVFGVIFGPIKQASSIWHYVVEWIQSISGPMSWIWSMASGTSYNIVLPVYATLAGAVVLAFYKRFGK